MFQSITLKEAKELIENNREHDGFVVLDVRTKEELQHGVLGKPLNIDISEPDFVEKIQKLDKEKTYLVYCRSGNRSKMAASLMKKLGFRNIYEIDEGIFG